MSSYRSWAFTIRPKAGVEEDSKLETEVLKWCKKQDFHFLCAEGKDECRHLHGQIWLENPREKGQVSTALQRIYERTIEPTPAEIKVLRSGVKIAYSKNFVEEYLSKEDSWISLDPPCSSDEEKYYPSEEESLKVKASANAVDKRFHRLSEMFKEDHPNYTYFHGSIERKATIGKWLADMMFGRKLIPVTSQKKHRIELCDNLVAYVWECKCCDNFLTKDDYEKYIEDIGKN